MPARFQIVECFVLALAALVLLSPPAHAYWDLSVGTYILQMLFAVGAGMWISARGFFAKKTQKPQVKPEAEPAAPDADKPSV